MEDFESNQQEIVERTNDLAHGFAAADGWILNPHFKFYPVSDQRVAAERKKTVSFFNWIHIEVVYSREISRQEIKCYWKNASLAQDILCDISVNEALTNLGLSGRKL